MRQAEAFLTGEGNNWYDRNKGIELNQTVLDALYSLDPKPTNILEVGCGDGRYLAGLHRHFGCRCTGIDASSTAITQGRKDLPALNLKHNTALPGLRREWALKNEYDLILFGFCLYLLDREDLFMTVAYADSILKDGGVLAIHDFIPRYPQVVPYKHKQGIVSYKMNYPLLWRANPAYRLLEEIKIREDEYLTILRKTGWERL
jgi:ubiquinone/menaquinone biosynthesis C-methylase UbiE